ncbi:hypothetical protein [Planctomycetes bacterium CA13]|uniref:hypothetical protein n=1 Tax=Novipirellula herctigrandis TaxID=2527986 RepID=UPI0011B56972
MRKSTIWSVVVLMLGIGLERLCEARIEPTTNSISLPKFSAQFPRRTPCLPNPIDAIHYCSVIRHYETVAGRWRPGTPGVQRLHRLYLRPFLIPSSDVPSME